MIPPKSTQAKASGRIAAILAKASDHHVKDENGDPCYNADVLEEEMAKLAMELIKESAERIGLWKNEAIGAADILRSEMDIVGKVANQATEIKKQFIETIRGLRMTVVTEVAATKKPLDDLREFFLGDDHEKEIKRLKEFVDLCERLENLKKNGVLDAVADTILKLS